jgi:hypothetical protein
MMRLRERQTGKRTSEEASLHLFTVISGHLYEYKELQFT